MTGVLGKDPYKGSAVLFLFLPASFESRVVSSLSTRPSGQPARIIRRLLRFLSIAAGLLGLASCTGLPARGSIGGQRLDARVDSEIARYYLQNYLADKRTDPAWDARIDRIYKNTNHHLPNRADLKELSDKFSNDFAAMYFAEQIMRVPANRRFARAYNQAYDEARKAFAAGNLTLPAAARNYEALVVPSYLYKRALANGADLSAPRAALEKAGLPCYFVETSDDGPVEANARIIETAIQAHASSNRRLIIISASKSG
ncbi:MAG TPA: hypothetical protein VE131_15260, partial [Terriglobales bacterium]|nr:hypothetical protein [Terriglobales bacterium]